MFKIILFIFNLYECVCAGNRTHDHCILSALALTTRTLLSYSGTGVLKYNNLLSGFSSAAACCKSLSWIWDLCSLCSAWKSYTRDKTQPMLSECSVDSDCLKTGHGAPMCLFRHKHTNWRASIQTVSTWFFCSCFWWARDSSLSFSTLNCLASSSMRLWFDTAST